MHQPFIHILFIDLNRRLVLHLVGFLQNCAGKLVGERRLEFTTFSIGRCGCRCSLVGEFAVDIQNAILAFAGRVLLKGCDLRFERGHRYGLVGQNGTGKTTLLNRLGAKDITGFPQDLRTWYIRHEVLCDDGVTVRQFLKQLAPEEKKNDGPCEAHPTHIEACGAFA